jgi:hypothetical protein
MRLHSIHCLVFDCLASGLKLLGVVVLTCLLELGVGQNSKDSLPTPTSLQVAFSLHLFELGAALSRRIVPHHIENILIAAAPLYCLVCRTSPKFSTLHRTTSNCPCSVPLLHNRHHAVPLPSLNCFPPLNIFTSLLRLMRHRRSSLSNNPNTSHRFTVFFIYVFVF